MTTTPALTRPWSGYQFSTIRWSVVLVAVSLLTAVVSILYSRSYIGHHDLDLDDAGHVSVCEVQTLGALKPQPETISVAVLASVHSLCYQKIAEADQLTDFGIRKSAYLNQQAQTTILMWMVVAITLSGVFLAGLQLVAAYKLATIGKATLDQGGALDIEQSKISIKSSVTGLIILAISLAFFIVFVSKVYLIQETHAPVDAPLSGAKLPAELVRGNSATARYQAQTAPNASGISSPDPGVFARNARITAVVGTEAPMVQVAQPQPSPDARAVIGYQPQPSVSATNYAQPGAGRTLDKAAKQGPVPSPANGMATVPQTTEPHL